MNAFTSNTEDISNKQVKVSSTQKDAVSVKIECPASIVIFDGELMKS
jgi:sRNA-binding carbon storage regulator CsrA